VCCDRSGLLLAHLLRAGRARITSENGITFAVGKALPARGKLTPMRTSPPRRSCCNWPQHCVRDLISCSPLYGWAISMRRREFIALIGGALALPPTARAQQPAKVVRIGFLGLGSASTFANLVEGLRAGLRDLGYVEGNNLVIEFRWAETVAEMPKHAAE